MLNREYENSDVALGIKELSDIALLILKNMGLPVPDEMTF